MTRSTRKDLPRGSCRGENQLLRASPTKRRPAASENYLRMDPDVDDEVIERFRPELVVLLVRWEHEDGVG